METTIAMGRCWQKVGAVLARVIAIKMLHALNELTTISEWYELTVLTDHTEMEEVSEPVGLHEQTYMNGLNELIG